MWFVRNVAHMDSEGEYVGRIQAFQVTEDFWPHYTDSIPDAADGHAVTIPAQIHERLYTGKNRLQ